MAYLLGAFSANRVSKRIPRAAPGCALGYKDVTATRLSRPRKRGNAPRIRIRANLRVRSCPFAVRLSWRPFAVIIRLRLVGADLIRRQIPFCAFRHHR